VYHVVARENHDAILCERFHRYLNKVQRIHMADTNSFSDWALGAYFATYAWNASPIDGTDVVRSFAAKGREFPFPFDVQADPDDNPFRIPQGDGQAALEHIESMFPLWTRQKELLAILNEERRERHRILKNQARTARVFQPGDLVLVRRQVKSQAKEGVMAKLLFKARGPYRVLERLDDGESYNIRKLPTTQGTGRRVGKVRKEAAMRLEKIPSSIILHKRVDGIDTRLASIRQPLTHTPLANELGLIQFGRYEKAPDNANFAFVRIAEMWQEEVSESDDTSDEDASDEDEIDDNTNGDGTAEGHNNSGETLSTSDNDDGAHGSEGGEAFGPTESVQASKETTVRRSRTKTTATMKAPKSTAIKRKQTRQLEPTEQPKRTSRRERQVPRRYKDDSDDDRKIEAKSEPTTLRQLWKRVNESKNKLFFIQRQHHGGHLATWFLVQVDLEETDENQAKRSGIYHCKWYIRNVDDSRKVKTRFARFWPEIHEFRQGVLGKMIAIRPDKVPRFIEQRSKEYAWYQDKVDLAKDSLVGPFDFMPITRQQPRQNCIDEVYWNELLAFKDTVDTTTIDEVDPLK
jgi:hypothetical protein